MGYLDEPPLPPHYPLLGAGVGSRFLVRVGDAFLIGLTGGSALRFFKGFCASPSGGGGRIAGGARAVGAYAPRVAGSFAAFSAVWFAVDSATFLARGNKEDEGPWSFMATTAAARGVIHSRRGVRAAARAALGGGALGVLVQGVLIVIDDWALAPPAVERPPVIAGSRRGSPLLLKSGSINWGWRWRRP
ncbi:unnamed protein product [Urochloa decumbens]|uniref:Uncharacterized protein n=1 Tax=Urochloa decumbens TaxID=240449 RepID=A0ABC8XYB0_9POAL